MLIDMHVHTDSHSLCSTVDPVDLVRRAEELNISGIAITEHDYVWSQGEIDALKKETNTDLLILRGQEVTSTSGHLLVYGYHKILDCISLEEIVHRVHQHDGVVFVSHPFRYGKYSGLSLEQLQTAFERFDGIEALNGNQSNEQNNYGLHIWESLGINGIGGSDAHSIPMVGNYVTKFQNVIRNEDDLIKELKAGQCSPIRYNGFVLKNE